MRRLTVLVLALLAIGPAVQLAVRAGSAGTSERLSGPVAVESYTQLPIGLILPICLEDTLSVKDAQKGQLLAGRIMQDVPLASREKLSTKALVKGSVLSIAKDGDGGVSLTLAFTQVDDRKQSIPMTTSLRAIASYIAVRSAQTPWTAADNGSPAGWANTIQIGGDVRYGDGGMVRNRYKQKVGKGVLGGVLVHVQANPSAGCEGPLNGDDHLQALWVFSADACGVYDLKDVKIAHNGNSNPAGQITLHFDKENGKVAAGAGMLLRVVPHP